VQGDLTKAPELIVDATVPETADTSWSDTDTMALAKKLDGARVFVDRDGVEAARFGATTSGTVMLFDASGIRLYAGGITGSRGHEGANAGRDCLEQLLRGSSHAARQIPTFGCRLCLPNEPPTNEANRTAAN
jgi:hypothetical protein